MKFWDNADLCARKNLLCIVQMVEIVKVMYWNNLSDKPTDEIDVYLPPERGNGGFILIKFNYLVTNVSI